MAQWPYDSPFGTLASRVQPLSASCSEAFPSMRVWAIGPARCGPKVDKKNKKQKIYVGPM